MQSVNNNLQKLIIISSNLNIQTNQNHKSSLVFCKYSKQSCTMICYCFKFHSTFKFILYLYFIVYLVPPDEHFRKTFCNGF